MGLKRRASRHQAGGRPRSFGLASCAADVSASNRRASCFIAARSGLLGLAFNAGM